VHKFWGWLGLNLGKHWVVALLTGAVLTIGLGYGITKLQFSTSQSNYLNKSDQVYKDNVKYQDLFGGEAMLTLITMNPGHTVAELFENGNLAQWVAVDAKLRASGYAETVVSPLTALQFNDALVQSSNGNPANSVAGKILLETTARAKSATASQLRTVDAARTLSRLSAVQGKHTLDNPQYLQFLLYDNQGHIRKPLLANFPDQYHAQIVTRLHGNLSIQDEGTAADYIRNTTMQLHFDNATVVSTGASELLKNLNDYLTSGMATLAAIAIVIMALILLVLFSVRWRLLPLLIVVVGVVWAFGIAGYLGIPLTVVTIAGLPVMLGIGIDYSIQMHARIEEEVIIDRSEHPIQESARNLGPALLIVTFDAIFAFAALHFAKVPMLRDFGLLLAVGVAAICVNSIMGTLAVLGIREYKMPTKGRDYRTGPLGRLVVWLGSLPQGIAVWLAAASIVVFFAGITVEGRLVLQTDPQQWVNQKSQVIKDLDVVQKETGSSSELGVFVQSANVFNDKTVGFVDSFTREQLAAHPETLLTGSSIVEIVSDLIDVPGAPHLAPTGSDVRAAWDVAPRDIQDSTVSPTHTAMNVIFRTGPSNLTARAVVVREMRRTVNPPPGVRATPSGLAVVGVGLLDNLEANRILLTYLSIVFVFAFLAIRLRSLIRALLSLVPVLIAVGAASLFAFAFSLKLSPMTAVGGPLVVAACTEFTSLILLRFVEERRRGSSPRQAVDVTAERTGRAFIVSALTAISGVAIIATSSLPLLRDFGSIVALNVAVALLSALVILPPILVWADQRGWVSRGLVPDDVLRRSMGPKPVPSPVGD
jgi:hydrophobe/amphiphile efflux-3 (HAE3) family protein